jgi:arginine exporter protein ArgO
VTVDDDTDRMVRVVAIICMTSIIALAIIGITVTAVLTDRNVHYAEGLSFAGTVLIAVTAGVTLRSLRRHRRWRIERENGVEE